MPPAKQGNMERLEKAKEKISPCGLQGELSLVDTGLRNCDLPREDGVGAKIINVCCLKQFQTMA